MAKGISLGSSKVTNLEQAYEEFIKHSVAKGLSEKTIRFYKENLGYFFRVILVNIILFKEEIFFGYRSY